MIFFVLPYGHAHSSGHWALGTAVLFACCYVRPALGRPGTDN